MDQGAAPGPVDGDGDTRADAGGGRAVNDEPNSFNGPVQRAGVREPPLRLRGDADRHATGDEPDGGDDFSQAGDLYRLMTPDQQAQLIGNLVTPLKTVPRFIQVRQLGHFDKADPDGGTRVAAALGIAVDEIDGRPERVLP